MNTSKKDCISLNDFIETDVDRRQELKEILHDCELEKIESPFYILWNVAAIIIGG